MELAKFEGKFREVDDLVLHRKGRVLVRALLQERGASEAELRAHSAELDRARSQLASLMQNGGVASGRAAAFETRRRSSQGPAAEVAAMSTPDLTSATAESNVLGRIAMSAAADPPEEPEYVFWYHTEEGSVCFYPPGSVQEHLVTEHGIDSLDVLRHANGHHDHARDHSEQAGLPMGAVGDLPAVGHAHEGAARAPHLALVRQILH
jgi:hypothetical protein